MDVHKRMRKHLEFGAIQTDSTEGRDVKGKRKREANVLSLGCQHKARAASDTPK